MNATAITVTTPTDGTQIAVTPAATPTNGNAISPRTRPRKRPSARVASASATWNVAGRSASASPVGFGGASLTAASPRASDACISGLVAVRPP